MAALVLLATLMLHEPLSLPLRALLLLLVFQRLVNAVCVQLRVVPGSGVARPRFRVARIEVQLAQFRRGRLKYIFG